MLFDKKNPKKKLFDQPKEEMLSLLKENQEKIKQLFGDLNIKLFGPAIRDTESGMGEINVIIKDDCKLSTRTNLQEKLKKLLKVTVNVYTEQTLKEQHPNHYQTKIDSAKTLEDIISPSSQTLGNNIKRG